MKDVIEEWRGLRNIVLTFKNSETVAADFFLAARNAKEIASDYITMTFIKEFQILVVSGGMYEPDHTGFFGYSGGTLPSELVIEIEAAPVLSILAANSGRKMAVRRCGSTYKVEPF